VLSKTSNNALSSTLLPSTTTLAPMVDHSVRVQAEPPAKMSSVPPLLV